MRTRLLCAAFATALVPAGAVAQSVTLTESEALARLADDSPRAVAARAVVDVARAEVLAAARWPNPRLTVNREAVAGVTEHLITVAQPLPVTGRRRLAVEAATARVEASASRASEQMRRLRADLRLAFTDLWAAQERERELTTSRDRLASLAAVLATREAAGDAAGFDRLRAEREVLDVATSRDTAAADRGRAQAILAGYIGASPGGGAVAAVTPSGPAAMVPPVDVLMARAEATRGDLAALARDADAARFAQRVAERLAIPEPEVVAGTKSSNAGGGDVGSILGVHVAVPLFDRGAPERAAAQARERQLHAEADVLRQTIQAQVDAWRRVVIERRAAAGRHRAALVAGADQIERIAQVSYDAGERGLLELLDAYRSAAAARVRQIELDASVREAEIELEFVSGWEMP